VSEQTKFFVTDEIENDAYAAFIDVYDGNNLRASVRHVAEVIGPMLDRLSEAAKAPHDVFDAEIERLNEKLYGSGREEFRGKDSAQAYCLGAYDALVAARHRFKAIAPMLAAQGEVIREPTKEMIDAAYAIVNKAFIGRPCVTAILEAGLAAQPVAQTDQVAAWAIEVEKMLCVKLGKTWSPTGMSIESLIAEIPVAQTGLPEDHSAFIAQAKALLNLDASGSLVPHGIGGLAREIIESAIERLSK